MEVSCVANDLRAANQERCGIECVVCDYHQFNPDSGDYQEMAYFEDDDQKANDDYRAR